MYFHSTKKVFTMQPYTSPDRVCIVKTDILYFGCILSVFIRTVWCGGSIQSAHLVLLLISHNKYYQEKTPSDRERERKAKSQNQV